MCQYDNTLLQLLVANNASNTTSVSNKLTHSDNINSSTFYTLTVTHSLHRVGHRQRCRCRRAVWRRWTDRRHRVRVRSWGTCRHVVMNIRVRTRSGVGAIGALCRQRRLGCGGSDVKKKKIKNSCDISSKRQGITSALERLV